uniref:Distal membrane arm assembly complex 2 like n=1 Tax=Anas platyrhynchos TaxID=8839 RepID=A0A8B9T894_ANAPL
MPAPTTATSKVLQNTRRGGGRDAGGQSRAGSTQPGQGAGCGYEQTLLGVAERRVQQSGLRTHPSSWTRTGQLQSGCCGAVPLVRYQGSEKWQQDYNGLPTGPLGKYKIEAINATESCIMYRGFDYLDGLEHVSEIKLQKCIYIQDECLKRLSETKNLQKSLLQLKIISCGNVTDKGIIALHKLTNLEYLYLSDLPGIKQKETTARVLQQALPNLELELDLE